MPGLQNIIVGGGFLLLGLVVTIGSYYLASNGVLGGTYAIAWGAVLFGGIQFVIGCGQIIPYLLRDSKGRAKHHTKIGNRAIIRCMINVAAADNRLDQLEISMIATIVKSVIGAEISRKQIREAFNQVRSSDYNFAEELSRYAKEVTKADALLATKCMVMVALSDGELHQREREELARCGSLLGLTTEEIVQSFREAEQAFYTIMSGALTDPTPLAQEDSSGQALP